MTLFVGTSGYSYKEWKGSFYPKDFPASNMLRFYAEQFNAVESNGTFYRMPTAASLAAWTAEVPPGFRFTVKAPQLITHIRRLKNASKEVATFLEALAPLKGHLGPVLFGLPPNFKKDLPRLAEFLDLLPKDLRAAFEFRHQSWLDDETFALLNKHSVALCIAEAEGDLETPFVSTADWGYLRLRLPEYTDAALKGWLKKIHKQEWTETFVFFKHEDEAKGPKFAKRFLELAAKSPSSR